MAVNPQERSEWRVRAYTSLPTCAKKCIMALAMAIYHFSAKVISRANGSSAVASAAYRSASELYDERLGRNHDFSNKAGVIHSEVLLPLGAPEPMLPSSAAGPCRAKLPDRGEPLSCWPCTSSCGQFSVA